MKKELLITTLVFALSATPALAAPKTTNDHAQNSDHHVFSLNVSPTISVSPTVTPSTTPTVTPEGEAVTTLKHDHFQPLVASEAAVSPAVSPEVSPTCSPDGTYKNHGAYVSCVAHEHLGGQAVSAAARSDIGKKTHPSVTPPVSSPVSSMMASLQLGFSPLQSLGEMFHRFFGFFSHFF